MSHLILVKLYASTNADYVYLSASTISVAAGTSTACTSCALTITHDKVCKSSSTTAVGGNWTGGYVGDYGSNSVGFYAAVDSSKGDNCLSYFKVTSVTNDYFGSYTYENTVQTGQSNTGSAQKWRWSASTYANNTYVVTATSKYSFCGYFKYFTYSSALTSSFSSFTTAMLGTGNGSGIKILISPYTTVSETSFIASGLTTSGYAYNIDMRTNSQLRSTNGQYMYAKVLCAGYVLSGNSSGYVQLTGSTSPNIPYQSLYLRQLKNYYLRVYDNSGNPLAKAIVFGGTHAAATNTASGLSYNYGSDLGTGTVQTSAAGFYKYNCLGITDKSGYLQASLSWDEASAMTAAYIVREGCNAYSSTTPFPYQTGHSKNFVCSSYTLSSTNRLATVINANGLQQERIGALILNNNAKMYSEASASCQPSQYYSASTTGNVSFNTTSISSTRIPKLSEVVPYYTWSSSFSANGYSWSTASTVLYPVVVTIYSLIGENVGTTIAQDITFTNVASGSSSVSTYTYTGTTASAVCNSLKYTLYDGTYTLALGTLYQTNNSSKYYAITNQTVSSTNATYVTTNGTTNNITFNVVTTTATQNVTIMILSNVSLVS